MYYVVLVERLARGFGTEKEWHYYSYAHMYIHTGSKYVGIGIGIDIYKEYDIVLKSWWVVVSES